MEDFWQIVLANLQNVGIGLAIFVAAYLSNMSFGLYYNIKILGQEFEWSKILASVLKILAFGVGTCLLTLAISAIVPWAIANGLTIPEEYSTVIQTVAILGICLTGTIKYIVEAFTKMKDILNSGKNEKSGE